MSAKERLAKVQAKLAELGARDVKFFFGKVSEVSPTDMRSDAADAFEAYLDSRHKKCDALGDSLRAPTAA